MYKVSPSITQSNQPDLIFQSELFMRPKKTSAIKAFLTAFAPPDLSGLYDHDMECQVTVAKDNGDRIEGDFKGKHWQGYSDGLQTWKPIRIPLNAMSEPTYEDLPMAFDLADHAEGIGMTGWDWKNKMSRWVAFDFDSISGHSDKHQKKLSDVELQKIRDLVSGIPWVTVRKSTGGRGLHIYVFVEPTHTNNHTEHAALARAILSQLSGIAGFEFHMKVDTCGGNMWVWHRKLKTSPGGLELLKPGTELAKVPHNWKDYVSVVTGRRQRNLPWFIEDQKQAKEDIEDIFEELTGQRLRTVTDGEHKKVMEWLRENYPNAAWWDAEHHMLVTHTRLLKECHETLNLKGKFETNAVGTEKGFDHNCFAGNTPVLTIEGPRTIEELAKAGSAYLYVFNGNKYVWMLCEIRSFGHQKTYPIMFGDGSIVRATSNHRWPHVKKGKRQNGFIETHEIVEKKTELPLASQTTCIPDHEGYAHGFVYGDGWIKRNRNQEEKCEVALFKEDAALKPLLLKYGNIGTQKYEGHGYVDMIRQLPGHWKELPINPTKQYAFGFILGLISADGFVDAHTQIFQSNYEALKSIRDLAIFAGLRCYPLRKYGKGDGFGGGQQGYAFSISNYNLEASDFLRKDHQQKFVKRGKHTSMTVTRFYFDEPKEEEVFCAVVPHYQNFTLANWVNTGNCFAFPIPRGAWSVRRYSLGVEEHAFWEQDGKGWTCCFFNREPDIGSACRIYEGIEKPNGGGYHFASAEMAQKAALLLGANLNLPNYVLAKKAVLRMDKTGKLNVTVDRDPDTTPMPGWICEKSKFTRLFPVKNPGPAEPEVMRLDEQVRHMITDTGEDCGWVIRSEKLWHEEPYQNVKAYLGSIGYRPNEVTNIMGSSIAQCWRIVNKPFEQEYPANREWNRRAPQFMYKPTINRDNLKYPTWLSILKHCGSGLDDAVKNNAWCKTSGILSGADYLKCWIAALFQRPKEPLPYLFFYSEEQNTGKSTVHEALSLLVTSGVERADQALTSQSNFNGELENAVLCVVEETDLRKNVTAYNRIKDWVTSIHLPIHVKGRTPYQVPNTTHWIQCANTHLYCPVFSGDTRITMICVPELTDMIPRIQLRELLKVEAPDFMAEILNLEIPPSGDRLSLPALMTEDKQSAAEANQSMIQMFVQEKCFSVPGHMVKFSAFCDLYYEWIDPNYKNEWSKIRIGRELPTKFPKARLARDGGQFYIGNMSFSEIPVAQHGNRYTIANGFLVEAPHAVESTGGPGLQPEVQQPQPEAGNGELHTL